MNYYGNQDILKQYKVGFLCSQQCPAEVVLRSYDWAREQRERGTTVVCGNHSQIEKDVFEILLKGKQPLILVLARGMMKVWDTNIKQAVNENRLLVMSPFDTSVTRVTRQTALVRNQKIIELSDKLVVGYISKGGQLDELLKEGRYHQVKDLIKN